jgi:cytochrome c-type biogenesis protein CcmH
MLSNYLKQTLCVALASVFMPIYANAIEATPLAADPVLEAKVMDIAVELRCLVCQNETIAGSHAELAIDLRNQIRTQLSGGQTKKEILDFMVTRYGEFVLYKPPLQTRTLFLWFGPFLLLILGMWMLFKYARRPAFELTISEEDLIAARALLHQDTSKAPK